MRSVRRFMGEEEEEDDLLSEVRNMATMSYKNRLIGFGITVGLSALFFILAFVFLPMIAISPAGFAVPFTLANICLVCSTFFLVGPMRQAKAMFKPHRLIATIVFFLAMIFTLVAAFKLDGVIQWVVVLLMVCIQIAALLFYAMSYIPFAQQLCTQCCSSVAGSIV